MKNTITIGISSVLVAGLIFSTSLSFSTEEELIPSWIKNTAGFWAGNQISDIEFMNAIEYLIGEEIIQVPYEIPKAVAQVDTTSSQPTTFYVLKKEVDSSTDSRSIYFSKLYCDDGDTAISGGYEPKVGDMASYRSFPIKSSSDSSSYDGWELGFWTFQSVGRQSVVLYIVCADSNN